MNRPIKIKIDVSKIDKTALYRGEKAIYLDAVAWPNKSGVGKYGDTHYLVQELPRERRDDGDRGAIIGNMTVPDNDPPQPQSRSVKPAPRNVQEAFPDGPDGDEDDIPF